MDLYKERFKDALWAKNKKNIIIGGAGGIGSWTSLFLSRCGHEIHIYDFDTVDPVNIAGQFYSTDVLGENKVDAIAKLVHLFSNENVLCYNEKYTEESLVEDIMISGFDNMAARKVMFDNWKKDATEDSLFIDGRMSAESYDVFFVTINDIEEYEKTLFDDSEVEEAVCSYKTTTHNCASLASDIVYGLNIWLNNKVYGEDLIPLPFHVRKEGTLLSVEIKNN